MANNLYLVQVSKNSTFTEMYLTRIYTNLKEAEKGYKLNEEIIERFTNNHYIRLKKVTFVNGCTSDNAGKTLQKNY